MSRCHKIILYFWSLLCVIAQLNATDWVVSTTGGGDFTNIRDAVTASSSGDIILLTAGQTFTGAYDRNITITKSLTFDRTGVGDDPIIDMGSLDRFCTVNTTVTVSMSNLVIQNGSVADEGGAIHNNGGYLYIAHCTFDSNESSASVGGAIYDRGYYVVQATDCIFSNNRTGGGHGGACWGDQDGIITVVRCSFNDNSTIGGGRGGAIGSIGSIYADSCTFNNNSAALEGGAIFFRTLSATHCTFNNSYAAGDGGGALYGLTDSILTMAGCTFSNNNTLGVGGAIFSHCQTASVNCSRFINNTALGSTDAIFHDGSALFDATNNWWGTNAPDASTLLYGVISYTPWLVINVLPTNLIVTADCPNLITADFTQNSSGETSPCPDFFSGTVTFSTAAGTIMPTTRALIDGQATVTLSGIASFDPFSLCVFTDADVTTTPYEYCRTATPITGIFAYVSPTGDDANPGTETSPVRTIARGIEIATTCDVTGTVYLEAGATFTGTGNKDITIAKSVNVTRYGIGADPVIDMEGAGRFCTINTDVTVSMSNLVVQNGNVGGNGGAIVNSDNSSLNATGCTFNDNRAGSWGGAISNEGNATLNTTFCTFNGNSASSADGGAISTYNYSSLNATGCTFNDNSAGSWGGAISNEGNATMNATGCTFNGNSASSSWGGAIYNNASSAIHCSRFINNTATQGNAIYNNVAGAVDASNNWWGSNADPATTPNLLRGTITSSPWIQMAFSIDPTLVGPGDATTLTVTFSSSCIPDGTPVTFSSIDGTITPTASLTLDGTATAAMYTYLNHAQACATTDNQTLCAAFNTSGFVRYNFGCICSDTGDEHVLIGAYDDPLGTNNLLLGCIFDSSTSTTRVVTPVDIGAHFINSVAVYNTESVTYIALLTRLADTYYLRLGTCADQGTGIAFTLSPSLIALDAPAAKVQWALGNDATPYVVTDVQNTLSIFEANLATLSLTLHDTTTNMAGTSVSSFLYWSFQDTGLYVVQGYDASSVATYQVDPDTGLFVGTGVVTDVSSVLPMARACSTCYDYLTLGGANVAGHATLASYNITTSGELEYITSVTLPGTVANYCERCCCGSNPLLVATDDGLYATNPATFGIIASNTTMPDNNWVNTCWCCDRALVYCVAINGGHNGYIFEQQGTNLVEVLGL